MENERRDAAVVLLSGGQDSTTCLFWAKQIFNHVEGLGFDYGQKHNVELEQAGIIAAKAGVEFTIFNIQGTLSGSSLIEYNKDIAEPHERNKNLPSSFVPGRNALFLTIAASYAYNKGITNLVGGMCETDYSGYPDCRRAFLDSLQTSLSLAMDTDVSIHTPLMYLSKAETWKMAKELGVLDIVRFDSHTDYNGNRNVLNEWGYGQLDNPASILRARGFEEAKAKGWI
ncbi:7-cyano-7-deazaguanine synthase [Adhaeribacter aerolatus]|uniref:7-cyano-7-deazaguanine synthase n=1 Tax=Adhaeribacter aerolatus TaxID=670289 RepID=A0A512B2I2_9BACT|nr:7-cyano-7-deazaguanine synthase QueC [Adhaeribacter aerolatus]GEO06160.1 7-cyano-7-deazaguanine synthase [Adhaeribacter aerolatus]